MRENENKFTDKGCFMKWPKLKRDHVGLMVKTLKTLKNGYCEIPPGTICMVTYSRGGLHLTSKPCKNCGIRVMITKVSYNDVKLIALLADKNMRDGQKPCPKCWGTDIEYTYADCLCHRTYEGNGRTCWQYPTCKTCGFTSGPASANSAGTCWAPF